MDEKELHELNEALDKRRFPLMVSQPDGSITVINEQIELRDYFAAQALGLSTQDLAGGLSYRMMPGDEYKPWFRAMRCYEIADAMMAERSRGDKEGVE